jgi:phosphate transport system protein
MTERPFDGELKSLREMLLEMATRAEDQIALAVKALTDRDDGLAYRVLEREAHLNRLDIVIDELGLRLLALRQPLAADLRFITSAMKISGDLERIGDLAVNIAERTLDLLKAPPVKPLIDIPRMAEMAQGMVRDALAAFIDGKDGLAREVCERDDLIDRLNDQVFRELLTYMIQDRTTISRAVDLILVGRHLERIADHATNIAEDVIYMVKGKTIKHHIESAAAAIWSLYWIIRWYRKPPTAFPWLLSLIFAAAAIAAVFALHALIGS